MAAVRLLHPFLPLFLFFLLSPLSFSISDSDAMLRLKKSFTNATALDSWTHSSTPCSGENPWVGVVCYRGIITGLRLGQMGLSGKIDIDALKEIPGLRTVSFVDNAFSGPIPEFNQVGALKAIFLSGNQFSGEIPSDYFSKMESLKKVWLSSNNFTGEIPESLGKLPHLIELHLEDNQFSGAIPSIGQPTLTSLNVSNNKLQGEIPSVFSKFNNTSFTGNTGLCGAQLGKDCEAMPVEEPSESQVQSDPGNAALGFGTIAAVILMLVVAAIIVGRRKKGDFDVLGRENPDEGVEVHSSSSGLNWKSVDSSWKARDSSRKGSYSGKQGNGVGDLVVVNGAKGVFGLPDLMKAAAEVLGNGGLGSAYKAVMSSGVAVVVKRMRDMNRVGRDGFDAEIRRLGKLRHPNILTPLAYHFRKEEKLLVYEYIPKGSLLYLLHGDRGPSHAELNWPARLKIVQGIARGMGYLHSQLASHELPHGNLKSSNVLLSPDYEPLLADYGFCSVVDPTQASQAMFAYKSPEFVQYRRVSPKCDVYCLGILILEILTGKFPSQYLNNGKGGTDVVQWVLSAISQKRESELFDPEITCSTNSLGEMERLIHIGAACTEQSPEKRLDMKEAIRRIEEIQVEESQDGTSIQITTSLRDGYTDPSLSQSHALNVHEGNGELSTQRTRQESFRDLSGRRNGENFDFSIS